MFWSIVLDVSTVAVILGLIGWLVYDITATLTGFQTISSKVQNWGYTHRFWLVMLGTVIIGAMVGLLVHFLWP
jgi:hypothetical protein